jgi:Kef-type K+ transport system membrane component KefB
LLIWTPQVGSLIVGIASHPEIVALRYFEIPLVGFSIGFTIFLWTRGMDVRLDRLKLFATRHNQSILMSFCSIFFLFFFPCLPSGI